MIYLDTSVVLAYLLAEDRRPPDTLWSETLVSSRLLEYEVWTRIHSLDIAKSHGDAAEQAIARINFLELATPVLARALEPFPVKVRTLDALHLASAAFLRDHGHVVEVLTYDDRMLVAAKRLKLPLSLLCE